MRKEYRRQVAQYAKQSQRRSIWRKFVQFMACIVVFCTTYALILPSITMEQTYSCGLEEHVHGDSCYTAEENQLLICTSLPENEEHSHSVECYLADVREVMTCTLAEHQHVDQCRSDPGADLETEEDWRGTLDQVSLTGSWDLDLAAIANTQIGYRESEKNYQVQADGTLRGYSRYGAWYGIPYGKWDAMFAAFCMHYAHIPQGTLPFDTDTENWHGLLQGAGLIRSPGETVPAPGDLVFFAGEDGKVSRVAIVTAATEEKLKLAEGDSGNRVLEHSVPVSGEGAPAGFVSILSLQNTVTMVSETETTEATESSENTDTEETSVPTEPGETTIPTEPEETTVPTEPEETTVPTEPEETTIPTEPAENIESIEPNDSAEQEKIRHTVETENYIVEVSYSPDWVIPEGAGLQVTEYARDSEIFRQRCQEAGYELQWLLNIGFFLNGEELELEGSFDVMVTSKEGTDLGTDVTHFTDDGAEHIEGTAEEDNEVTFSSDGFSDFGGGNAQAMRAAANYPLTTANPANLQEGVNYIIYAQGSSGNQHILMGSDWNITPIRTTTGYWSSPYNIGGSWELTAAQVGNADVSQFTWRVVRQNGQTYLVSVATGQRLTLNYSGLSMSSGGTALGFRVNGAATEINGGDPWLRYENNDWRNGWYNGTSVYFAALSTVEANYPHAVHTGEVNINRLRFFNICANGDNGVSALAGCVFEITGGNGYTATVVSGSEPEVRLPAGIPDGTYTITEVSAPEGYIRDTEYSRSFTIKNGALVSDATIGIFVNHNMEQLSADKRAMVADYANRIYQVDLTADSHLRMYQMDPMDLLFVVDQSNSMLFPSGLVDIGKRITLRQNGSNNASNLDALNLDKSKVHYVIADPRGTSTVWAIWHDGTAWMCQDASYYAKAKHKNDPGYQDDNETVIFPSNRSYADQRNSEPDGVRSNGCGIGYDLTGGSLGNYIQNQGGTVTFTLYQSTDEYNRLHYLEEALANLIYEMADVNDQNRITLTRFSRTVDEEHCIGPLELTPANTELLAAAVTSIKTSGGTRQDRALEHVYEEHLNDPRDNYKDFDHNYTLLITDGAPVRSGDDAPSNVGDPNDPANKNGNTIYSRIKGHAADVRGKSHLMTVALGMEGVEAGKQVLEEIATDDSFYCALDDASQLLQFVQKLLFESFRPKEAIEVYGDIVDEISDSFYPIAWVDRGTGNSTGRQFLLESNGKDWVLPQPGDWLTRDGKLTAAGAANAAGQLLQRENGTYYVQWTNQNVTNGWKGTVYVKAKEDFIGGNAIDTNKAASVTVHGAAKSLDTPTVNVRLLDLNEYSSEVTLYLGDTVNGDGSSPISVLQEYYQNIRFTKLISDGGSVLNKVSAAGGDGLEEDAFYLKYAIGRDLTADEWTALMEGESLTVPYTYDDPSSHGAVGAFTITLTKRGPSSDYGEHTATHACHPGGIPSVERCEDPAENYTLRVVYTAFRLNRQGRPSGNVRNGAAGPGTEVGTGSTLPTGLGTVDSINTHEVHVISGSIVIRKIIEESLVSQEDQTFTFTLHRMEDGEDISRDMTKTITVPAGSTQGATRITFSDLPRGTYIVTEAVSDTYALKQITVNGKTNCQSTPAIGASATEVTFVLGNNVAGYDVIGFAAPSDRFTSYVDPVNGVYGEAVFTNGPMIFTGEIPVVKQWDDGADIHTTDAVYLLLLKDGIPMLDSQGNARLLRLDASNNWQGTFTVTLADKTDKVSNYAYSVREVSAVSNENLYTWSPAVLENDGTTLLYYERALEDGQLGTFGGRSYVVHYEAGSDDSWTVTNLHAVELPMTGGIGTSFHTLGGLALIAYALMHICITGRKRRKEAN